MFGFIKNKLADAKAGIGIGLIKMDTRLSTRLFIPITPGGLVIPAEEINAEFLEWLKAHPASEYPQHYREDTKGRRERKHRVVTTAFVDFVVDQLQTETSVFGDFKYHGCGLGVGAEAAGDTDLGTDSGIARATGSQTETDHDTYKSVGTMTMDDTEAITEHGLFNVSSSVPVLMDRTVFSAINVVSGNQIEFTFEISFTAGG